MTHLTGNAPDGTPGWLDLGIPDMARATAFYGALFGWEFEDAGPEAGHYHLCRKDGRQVAGLMAQTEPGSTYWWNLYFATDDCDGTAKRVADAGGTVVEAPMDVMQQGRMAIVKDPGGAQFGLWQGKDHIGPEVVDEPGSLIWSELLTADPKSAPEFYAAVFGHTTEPVPMEGMDYALLRRPDGREIGGILGVPDAAEPTWLAYFGVADVEEALRAVREGGGEADPPFDSPYGPMADVRDPFGVKFRIGGGMGDPA